MRTILPTIMSQRRASHRFCSVPAGEALLEARIVNVKPPFVNFYRAAIGAVDRASEAHGRRFAALAGG